MRLSLTSKQHLCKSASSSPWTAWTPHWPEKRSLLRNSRRCDDVAGVFALVPMCIPQAVAPCVCLQSIDEREASLLHRVKVTYAEVALLDSHGILVCVGLLWDDARCACVRLGGGGEGSSRHARPCVATASAAGTAGKLWCCHAPASRVCLCFVNPGR